MDFKKTPNKKIIERYTYDEIVNPIISIVTPFYNDGEYILETANSVLNQSFIWYEWIIIDDGSTDKKSLDILEKVKNMDDRIKVYHKKNTGLANTRDFGAKKSSKNTNYLLFLDSDDLIESNYLECTYFSMQTNPTASFAYTDTIGFGTQEYLWDKKMNIKDQMHNNLLVATALIKKDDYNLVGGYGLKEKKINEDWIFWTKLFTKSKIPLKLNYYGFWYRRKENGELQNANSNKSRTQELLSKYKKNVDYAIEPLQYPKDNYDWDYVKSKSYNFEVPSKVKPVKKNILFMMPQMVVGGADKFNIDFLKGLDYKKYSVTAVITNISNNNWLDRIKDYVDDYYILPSFLDRMNWHKFIEYLIIKNDTKLIFNTNSVYGYMSLPYIKSRFMNIKIIDYIHMEEWYNRNGGYSRDSSAVSSVIDLTLTCNKNSEKILKTCFGRKNDNIKTCYIGVDEKKFKNDYKPQQIVDIKNKFNIPLNKKIISFIARIDYQKRPFLLIEIIKEYVKYKKDSLFLICGDGALLDDVKHKIKEYKLNDFVLFLGKINNTKEIYAISDVTLNCSIKEGLALTTYESLSMGVPVVSSDVGGQSEIIDNKVGALITPVQSEDKVYELEYSKNEINLYVKSLIKVVNNCNKLSKNCRKKILSRFTIDQMNINMNSFIEKVLNDKNNREFKNEDIAMELLNQYLLESKSEYNYFINVKNLEYFSYNCSFKDKFKDFIKNHHLYLIANTIYKIIKYVLLIVKSIFMIIVTILSVQYLIFKKIFRRKVI